MGNEQKYWDPEKSSRDKFVALGLGTESQYNFSALASKLLGQAQPAQFQSSDQTGYLWGSLYQDADDGHGGRAYSDSQTLVTEGGLDVIIDGITYKVATNVNAEMPRSWDGGDTDILYGGLYNFYAATTESALSSFTNANAPDSLCPSGWMLPIGKRDEGDKTYKSLFTSYGLPTNPDVTADDPIKARKAPISFTNSGLYSYDTNRSINSKR